MPNCLADLRRMFGDPFLHDAVGARVVVPRDGAAEDVACAGVDLQVEEGSVQEDVCGVI